MAFTNALADANRTIRFQRWFMVLLVALVIVGDLSWRTLRSEFTLHTTPDLSKGATVTLRGVADVPAPNVYLFAFHMLQQVNRWADNGLEDYGERIHAMQNYLTPSCRQYLLDDMQRKADRGELSKRTRALHEIPGYGFAASRVQDIGAGGWTVLLDTQITETTAGVPVKDTFIRYPVNVVRYDVDREKNPWQLALNCYGGRSPQRLDESALSLPLSAIDTPPAANMAPAAKPTEEASQ